MTIAFDPLIVEVCIRLAVAMLLGLVIGTERVLAHKTAGMRTYALMSMGSALFITISVIISQQYAGITDFDPLRIAAQVIAGAGFLGAGLILVKGESVTGLTSSTGMWVSAGIGMAAGFGLYSIALLATLLTLFIFVVLWFIEDRLRHSRFFKEDI